MRKLLLLIFIFLIKISTAQTVSFCKKTDSAKNMRSFLFKEASFPKPLLSLMDGQLKKDLTAIDIDSIEHKTSVEGNAALQLYGADPRDGAIDIETKTFKREGNKVLNEVLVVATYCVRRRVISCGYSVKCTFTEMRTADTTVKKVAASATVNIYPNPVSKNEVVNIETKSLASGIYSAQLLSTAGTVVQQDLISIRGKNAVLRFQIKQAINSGTYFLRLINSSNKLIHTGKLVVL